MASLPSEFRLALHAFAQSSSTFRILRTVRSASSPPSRSSSVSPPQSSPQSSPPSPAPLTQPPEKLHVLDSSFNPPTLGHLSIILSALREVPAHEAKHVLLLLATQNADKAAKPASFEMRLAMMVLMAEGIVESIAGSKNVGSSKAGSSASAASPSLGAGIESEAPAVTVSIGVTKHPYFIDKSHDIAGTGEDEGHDPAETKGETKLDEQSDAQTPFPFPPTHQIHLIGFDTFIRLMNPKYYPPSHTLAPLDPLFANHSVRVTYRTDGVGEYADKEAQRRYVGDIADGKRADEGARPEWAERVRLVEGRDDEEVTSSTEAREGAGKGDWGLVRRMCGERMAEWVKGEGLYREGGEGEKGK